MAKLQFHVVSHVTVPNMKLDTSRPNYIRFESPIRLAVETEKQKATRAADREAGKLVMGVPEIARVTNLETGEIANVVANELLRDQLHASYPNDSYVGKCFAISKFAPEGKRKYATFNIAEIEIDMPEPDAQETEVNDIVGEPIENRKYDIPLDAAPEPEPETHTGGKRKR